MKNYWKVLEEATDVAMKDLDFRKRLLEDANKAIKERLNEDLPAKAIFHESDPKHLVFVLPLKERIVQEGEELEEDVLDSVAGGAAGSGKVQQFDAGDTIESKSSTMIYGCSPDF